MDRDNPFGDEVVSPGNGISLGGIGKAIATGVRGGVEGMAGAGGDLVTWERGKVAQLAKWLGATPETVAAIESYGDNPTRGPGMIQTPDVQQFTDKAVSALPESVSGPVQDITRHTAQNPVEELAQTAGGFLPSAVLPGSIAAKAARVAIPAAATETAGQVTRQLAPEYENLARIAAGFLSGGGVGAAEGGFRLRSALRAVNTNPEAVKRVQQLLLEQGMSVDDAAAAMQKLGPDGMLLDVGADTGATLRQEAQQIHARGGEGRGIIGAPLREREAGKNQRLEGDVEATVGARQQPSAVIQALEDRMTRVSADQRAAHSAQQAPVQLQSIADDIDARLVNEKSPKIRSTLARVARCLLGGPRHGEHGGPPLETGSPPVLSARQAISEMLYEADGSPKPNLGPKEKQVLNDLYAKINEALDPANPTLRRADAEIAQIGKEETAFEERAENLRERARRPDRGRVQADLRRDVARRAGAHRGRPQRRDLPADRHQGQQPADPQDMMKGEGKWNQQKVASVIGEEKAQRLMDAISREATFQESYQKIVQGSKTAETVSGPRGGSLARAIPEVAVAGTLGGWPAAGASAFSNLRRYMGDRAGTRSASGDAEVAGLLSSTNPDDIVQAARILKEGIVSGRKSGARSAVIDALLARQQERQ